MTGLTGDDGLFASLWLDVAQDAVIEEQDGYAVADRMIEATEHVAIIDFGNMSAREKSGRKQSLEPGSAWVH